MSYFILSLIAISETTLFLSLLPFVIKKIEVESGKSILVFFIAFGAIAEIYASTTASLGINNRAGSHIYFAFEFFFFFFLIFNGAKLFRSFWFVLGMLVGCYVLLDNFFITPFSRFAIFSLSIQNLLLFLFSITEIILITQKKFIPLYRDDRFFIITGIFIYSSISALMYLVFNFYSIILPFHIANLSTVCLNAFFTYSMVIYYRRRKILVEALK